MKAVERFQNIQDYIDTRNICDLIPEFLEEYELNKTLYAKNKTKIVSINLNLFFVLIAFLSLKYFPLIISIPLLNFYFLHPLKKLLL